jgi:hypothetical protein
MASKAKSTVKSHSANSLEWEFDSGLRKDVWRKLAKLKASTIQESQKKTKTSELYRKLSRKK